MNRLSFRFRKPRLRHPHVGGHREAAAGEDLAGGQVRRRRVLVRLRLRRRQDVRRPGRAHRQLGGLLRLRGNLLRRVRLLPPLRAEFGAGSDLLSGAGGESRHWLLQSREDESLAVKGFLEVKSDSMTAVKTQVLKYLLYLYFSPYLDNLNLTYYSDKI